MKSLTKGLYLLIILTLCLGRLTPLQTTEEVCLSPVSTFHLNQESPSNNRLSFDAIRAKIGLFCLCYPYILAHELGHTVFVLLFGLKIKEFKLTYTVTPVLIWVLDKETKDLIQVPLEIFNIESHLDTVKPFGPWQALLLAPAGWMGEFFLAIASIYFSFFSSFSLFSIVTIVFFYLFVVGVIHFSYSLYLLLKPEKEPFLYEETDTENKSDWEILSAAITELKERLQPKLAKTLHRLYSRNKKTIDTNLYQIAPPHLIATSL